MAGIYLHIPFCKTRCIYCGFYSTTRLGMRQEYVQAMCRELKLRAGEAGKVHTVYLGGGTPSQLTVPQLQQLLTTIRHAYEVADDAEITMECNPDDVTPEFAEALSTLSVNRVSMGVQTFATEQLRFIGRRHTADQVGLAVERLRKAGIGNISIDLMYGIPGQTTERWEHDIDRALALQVEHISAYSLTFEEKTPLYQLLQQGKVVETDEETSLAMYDRLINRLEAAGYEQYEISNFALPGYRSRHNSSYWTGIPYLGIGAAAHSYDGKGRQWNVSSIQEYTDSIARGIIPMEREVLDRRTRYNDTLTTAMRTREGMDLSLLPADLRDFCQANAQPFLHDGRLEVSGNRLRLTRQGLFVSDLIMSELMDVDERDPDG